MNYVDEKVKHFHTFSIKKKIQNKNIYKILLRYYITL